MRDETCLTEAEEPNCCPPQTVRFLLVELSRSYSHFIYKRALKSASASVHYDSLEPFAIN